MKKAIAFMALLAAATWAHAQFSFELQGQVAYIDDGDTFILHPGAERVRVAEIDAPETDHGPGKPGQPHGSTARAALAAMMPVGSEVKAQCYERDANGRAVCRVFFQNIDISLEMARLGHAHAYKEYVRDPRIIGAADFAKARQLGLWASADAVYPQTWRHTCWQAGSQPLYCSVSESSNTQPVLLAQAVTPIPTHASAGKGSPTATLQDLAKHLIRAVGLLQSIQWP